ncbi:nucleotide exchange factor GrpE [Brachyspira hampsonii]|uniref:Protein GrpE n=2 Tax=Brachyspira hampsonii TaxID=1287055 RepID=A0A2U4FM28_9SPIR|nr:nucleotide exchange factor GrpE [Brachyspira hampsonii]EKV56143.1 protein grpE [Brachyspira hampsonii 30446]MBW5388920.1 nucleotide exchange factor GrpE [Brachyspira hampsonii]OEJ18017.1 nucleotide exchange factor GrpE [Brachyspira hampsonii]
MEEEIKENSEDKKEEENVEAEAAENNEQSEENTENNTEDEITALKKRIEELENESADMKNKYMYAMAEAENIRKRTSKEKIDGIKRANKELLLSLLNFMDNFERALKAGEKEENIQNSEYYKGISLIHKQFIDFMHDNGVSEIESLGEEFDPNVHEALTMIEVPDLDKEKVVEVYAKGYKLNDELLRTAKVVVGKPPAAPKE